jgi:uncharacterized phage infection (PIP) family protein YhgE
MKKNGLVIPAFVWNPVISLTALILLFSMANCCLGFQDSAQQAVDDLKAQMATLNSQLTTIEAQINNGDGDLTALQSKYQDVLDELMKGLKDINKEFPVLEARYQRLIQLFEDYGIKEIEAFVTQKMGDETKENAPDIEQFCSCS